MLAQKNDKKMTEELSRYMKSDLGRNPQGKVKGGGLRGVLAGTAGVPLQAP